MEDRIKQVMSEIFNINVKSIDENTSPEVIESWDSLKHMNLIIALEEEFDIEFGDENIQSLLNFKLIKITIEEIILISK